MLLAVRSACRRLSSSGKRPMRFLSSVEVEGAASSSGKEREQLPPKPRESGSGSKEEEEQQSTHFGFQRVPLAAKTGMVQDVFDRVAGKYDLMNDVMSLGVHRLWKNYFVANLKLEEQPDTKLLDVAGGTGDIAFRCASSLSAGSWSPSHDAQPQITVCDLNEAMLDVGREKAKKSALQNKIEFVCDDAQTLESIADNHYDVYTIAFGLRNVSDVDAALRSALRVLRRGGRLEILEFSSVQLPVLSKLYELYSFHVIPSMGGMIAGDRASYDYLVESIRQFPSQDALVDRIQRAGFAAVRYQNLSGGIAAIHSAVKL